MALSDLERKKFERQLSVESTRLEDALRRLERGDDNYSEVLKLEHVTNELYRLLEEDA